MTDTATQVIYARVPAAFKREADAYAEVRGATLTRAVVELLQKGLAVTDEESTVAELRARVDQLSAEKETLEARLHTAEAELGAVRSLAQRIRRPIGKCPACDSSISGYELLGSGQCEKCQADLSHLILPLPEAKSTLNQRELLILVGALGAVLGIAYLASKKED